MHVTCMGDTSPSSSACCSSSSSSSSSSACTNSSNAIAAARPLLALPSPPCLTLSAAATSVTVRVVDVSGFPRQQDLRLTLCGGGASSLARMRMEPCATLQGGVTLRADVACGAAGVLRIAVCAATPAAGPGSEPVLGGVVPLLVAPNAAVCREMLAALDSMAGVVQQACGQAADHEQHRPLRAVEAAWASHFRQLLLDMHAILGAGSSQQPLAALLLVGVLEFLARHECWATAGWLLAEARRTGLLSHARAAAHHRLQQLQPLLSSAGLGGVVVAQHAPQQGAHAAAAASAALAGLTLLQQAAASPPGSSQRSERVLGSPAGCVAQAAAAAAPSAPSSTACCSSSGGGGKDRQRQQRCGCSGYARAAAAVTVRACSGSAFAAAIGSQDGVCRGTTAASSRKLRSVSCTSCSSGSGCGSSRKASSGSSGSSGSRGRRTCVRRCWCSAVIGCGACNHVLLGGVAAVLALVVVLLLARSPAVLLACQEYYDQQQRYPGDQGTPLGCSLHPAAFRLLVPEREVAAQRALLAPLALLAASATAVAASRMCLVL